MWRRRGGAPVPEEGAPPKPQPPEEGVASASGSGASDPTKAGGKKIKKIKRVKKGSEKVNLAKAIINNL